MRMIKRAGAGAMPTPPQVANNLMAGVSTPAPRALEPARTAPSSAKVGKANPRRGHRGPDPVLGLADCGVGQPGEFESLGLTPDVSLDLHRSCLTPHQSHGSGGRIHDGESTEAG